MPYQPFSSSSSNVNRVSFPWGMPNHSSAQGVETEETYPPAMNVDGVEDQDPKYRGPHITFHIFAQPVEPNPYVFATLIPPFPNNVVFQYAHSGEPLAPNLQPGGEFSQEGTLVAHTLNLALLYYMFQQFMLQPMPAHNVIQPPPRVATQRVPKVNQPRPAD